MGFNTTSLQWPELMDLKENRIRYNASSCKVPWIYCMVLNFYFSTCINKNIHFPTYLSSHSI